MIRKLFVIFLIMFTSLLHAEEEHSLMFGPEFTFDTNSDDKQAALNKLNETLKKTLLDDAAYGRTFYYKKYNGFYSPDGWHFKHKTDIGVIETVMSPITLEDAELYADDIQAIVFEPAYAFGYYPKEFLGGGHVNLSAQYFIDKANLFRNFLVDLLNHSELGLGIWNYDTNNSFSPALMEESTWDKIREHIKEFDESEEPNRERIEKLAKEVASVFSSVKDPYYTYWTKVKRENSTYDYDGMAMYMGTYMYGIPNGVEDSLSQRLKYTSFNFGKVGDLLADSSRIEIRAFRAQPDFYTFLRQIRLIQKRLNYLDSLGSQTLLRLKPNYRKPFPNPSAEVTQDMALTPPMDPQHALAEYYKYVTESGEKWEDHTDYIWPAWIQNGELEKFNKGLCNQILGASN